MDGEPNFIANGMMVHNSGKTVLTAHMLKTASDKGHNSWFLVHRRELLEQTSQTFKTLGIPHNICTAGSPSSDTHSVTIGTVQTVSRRLGRLRAPTFVIYDECHHICGTQWTRIYNEYPSAYRIGLTATPQRLDGKGLRLWFSDMVMGPTVKQLTRQGFLAPYKCTHRPPSRWRDYIRAWGTTCAASWRMLPTSRP